MTASMPIPALAPSEEARRLVGNLLHASFESGEWPGNVEDAAYDAVILASRTAERALLAHVAGLEAKVARLRGAGDVAADRRAVLPCSAALPTPDMIRARLLRDGWSERSARHPGVFIYDLHHPDFDGPLNLVLPRGEVIEAGWRSSIEGALRTLAGLEDRPDGVPDRPAGDIAAEIIAAQEEKPHA